MMKIVPLALLACATMCFAQQAPVASDAEVIAAEAWAFPQFPPADPLEAKPDPHKVIHIAGSARSYTQAQLDIDHFVPDWFPQDHSPMPQIVMVDRKPGWPWPCAESHIANGAGVPATAQIMGCRRHTSWSSSPRSDKYWAEDPQGVRWETFHTHGEATTYSAPIAHPQSTMSNACFGPQSSCCEPKLQAA